MKTIIKPIIKSLLFILTIVAAMLISMMGMVGIGYLVDPDFDSCSCCIDEKYDQSSPAQHGIKPR